MAKRKPYLKTTDVKPNLATLLKNIKGTSITEDELREQRVSFAFGNAMGIDSITRDSVQKASQKIRITD